MGCDIHLRVQRRDGPGWVDVPNSEAFGPDPTKVWLEAFDKELAAVGKKRNELSLDEHAGCLEAAQLAQDALEDGKPDQRCYLLFARLAAVRNGFGVAGLESHNKVEWSLDISGPGIVVYDHDGLAALAPPAENASQLAARDVEEGRVTKPHFRMRWNDHALRDCGFARWLCGPRVRALATQYGADDVRVLIGFDS